MRRAHIAIVLLLLVLLSSRAFAQTTASEAVGSPVPAALTEAERCSVDSLAQRATIVALRAEIAQLQARVTQLEAPLVDQAVARERAQLEQRFRERLKPPADHVFDWSTLTFTAPAKAPAK